MPDSKPFRPFGSSDVEYEELLVLRDGVPPELQEPLLDLIFEALTLPWRVVSGRYLRADRANELRALIGVDLGQRAAQKVEGDQILMFLRRQGPQELLRLTDAMLHLQHLDYIPVERAFMLARSKWSVGEVDDSIRLVERVPEGVSDAMTEAFESGSAAGRLLHRAFTSGFGLTPNPGEAYRMSVKAVETAAHPVIEPKNLGATLGTMLAVMRNAKTGWTLPLDERADHAGANKQLLIAMAQVLWDGQEDRHRDGEVTLDEARAAFYAAVALVGWFQGGLVARAQTSP